MPSWKIYPSHRQEPMKHRCRCDRFSSNPSFPNIFFFFNQRQKSICGKSIVDLNRDTITVIAIIVSTTATTTTNVNVSQLCVLGVMHVRGLHSIT